MYSLLLVIADYRIYIYPIIYYFHNMRFLYSHKKVLLKEIKL